MTAERSLRAGNSLVGSFDFAKTVIEVMFKKQHIGLLR